jgi:predicted secreted protein
MQWYSALAIYALFWVLSAFLVLPFGVRTHDELGIEKVRGQADSAPGNFRPLRVVGYTTLVSAVLFGAFYINYVNGWVGAEFFNVLNTELG